MQYVTLILSLIQSILPLLTSNANTQATVNSIIGTLEKLLPMIETWSVTVYAAVKNIIAELSGTATDAETLAALQALDAKVDARWAAIETQLDPDAKAAPASG